ncbi:hypothetical protein [Piscinibacter terrae]|uniref:Uncharacterized protein n=1 Tax=Piscinibacter terrae TaxID=2496871 RepID=A0A3N7HS10_9BURK|nr:hypothetical protein [Albitalea terrae]RQP23601.1 hypothetical protein DZC73_15785 [Albitalea terrae]
MKYATCAVLLAICFASTAVQAMDPVQESAERDRIKRERDQADATYKAREIECRQRFVVTPCLDQARRDRREALDRLRQQQEVLDEAQRKQRAAQRMDEIRSKVSGDEAKQREAAAQKRRRQRVEPAVSQPEAAASSPAAVLKQEPPAAVATPASANASAMEVHEQKAQAYEKRQKEAAEHRAEVEARNAQRAANGKPPAKPLPTPASAASRN